MDILTKEELIDKLKEIRNNGWYQSNRARGNVGAVGNTLEDLLGIPENNLPIPNAAEWELKAQRKGSSSLLTLMHMEPSPRAIGFVPKMLLPLYGWRHEKAGIDYPENEMSFRQTISGKGRSDRGFMVQVDEVNKRIVISFDANSVDVRHKEWLKSVEERIGIEELNPQPYWGFQDLYHKAGSKLTNCFYLEAETKIENGKEYFHYTDIKMLKSFSIEKFAQAFLDGDIYVDFDARTGHNHGTKFRLKRNILPKLYEDIRII